jgi:hypothetical protein
MQPHDTSLPVTKVQRFLIINAISGIWFQEQEHITGRPISLRTYSSTDPNVKDFGIIVYTYNAQ